MVRRVSGGGARSDGVCMCVCLWSCQRIGFHLVSEAQFHRVAVALPFRLHPPSPSPPHFNVVISTCRRCLNCSLTDWVDDGMGTCPGFCIAGAVFSSGIQPVWQNKSRLPAPRVMNINVPVNNPACGVRSLVLASSLQLLPLPRRLREGVSGAEGRGPSRTWQLRMARRQLAYH